MRDAPGVLGTVLVMDHILSALSLGHSDFVQLAVLLGLLTTFLAGLIQRHSWSSRTNKTILAALSVASGVVTCAATNQLVGTSIASAAIISLVTAVGIYKSIGKGLVDKLRSVGDSAPLSTPAEQAVLERARKAALAQAYASVAKQLHQESQDAS